MDKRRVELAKQVVEVSAANVAAAKAALKESQALLAQYQSQADRWDTEVKRLSREVDRGVVDPQVLLESKNQLRSSLAARDAAKDTILKSEAQLISKNASEEQDKISIAVAQADLEVAESEARRLQALVGYLVLPAPFNGVITARNANNFRFRASGHRRSHGNGGLALPGTRRCRSDLRRRADGRSPGLCRYSGARCEFCPAGQRSDRADPAFHDTPISATVTRTAWSLNIKSRTLRAEIDLPNTDSAIPDDVPDDVRKSLTEVKLPKATGQILPGMYAYGNVIIRHSGVWAFRQTDLDYWHGKTFYWTRHGDRARRMEVQTGVSDSEWIEVTASRPLDKSDEPWSPIDGTEQVLVASDLSTLNEGETVSIAPPPRQETSTTTAEPDGHADSG